MVDIRSSSNEGKSAQDKTNLRKVLLMLSVPLLASQRQSGQCFGQQCEAGRPGSPKTIHVHCRFMCQLGTTGK